MKTIARAAAALFTLASVISPAFADRLPDAAVAPAQPAMDCMDWLITGRNPRACMKSLQYWGVRYADEVMQHLQNVEITTEQRAAYESRIANACGALDALDGRIGLEQVANAAGECVNAALEVAEKTGFANTGPLARMGETLLQISLKLIMMPNPRDIPRDPRP